MAFTNNFSTSFRWCDRLFGTDTKYQEYRARVKAMKTKSANKEDFQRMEKKLMEEVEKEGQIAEREVENGVKGKKQ